MSGDMILCLFVAGLAFLIFDNLMAGMVAFGLTAMAIGLYDLWGGH